MLRQVSACVRSERLAELGLAGRTHAPRTTPEEAMRLAEGRAATYGERRHPAQSFDERRLAAERAAATRDFAAALTAVSEAVRQERRSIPCLFHAATPPAGIYERYDVKRW